MEASPTYQRNIITLKDIRHKAEELEAGKQAPEQEEADNGGVISFG